MNFLAQRHAVNKLHRNEVHAVSFTNFIDVSDVRMIERRRSFGFLDKPSHSILIRSQFSRQNLQRHLAFELRVLRQIHFAHSTFADLRDNTVMRQSGVCREFFIHAVSIPANLYAELNL